MLVGRSWDALAETGQLSGGEPLLAALARRSTFRAVPVVLVSDDGSCRLDLDLSGAPCARTGQPSPEFAGFGLLRSVSVPSPLAALQPRKPDGMSPSMATLDQRSGNAQEPDPDTGGEDSPARATSLAPAALTLAALSLAALVPAARFGLIWTSGRPIRMEPRRAGSRRSPFLRSHHRPHRSNLWPNPARRQP